MLSVPASLLANSLAGLTRERFNWELCYVPKIIPPSHAGYTTNWIMSSQGIWPLFYGNRLQSLAADYISKVRPCHKMSLTFPERHSHYGFERKVAPVVAFVVWCKLCRPCYHTELAMAINAEIQMYARSNPNGPIRVDDGTTLGAAVAAVLVTSI